MKERPLTDEEVINEKVLETFILRKNIHVNAGDNKTEEAVVLTKNQLTEILKAERQKREEMMRAERMRHTMELDAISIKSIDDFVLWADHRKDLNSNKLSDASGSISGSISFPNLTPDDLNSDKKLDK